MSATAQAPNSLLLRKKSNPFVDPEAVSAAKLLRILTWNVAALRTIPSKIGSNEFQSTLPRTQVLKAFFDRYNVDIACFQEHKFSGWDKVDQEYACVEGRTSKRRLFIEGYDSFWSFSGNGYAGVVTYARTGMTKSFTDCPFSISVSKTEDAAATYRGRCMLTDHGDFILLNIYAPNAGRGPEYLERKMAFYSELSLAMSRWTDEGRKVIITGDINTAHTELDVYNPPKYRWETGFLDIERDWITSFLAKHKCKDVWRVFNPIQRRYTFWDQKRRLALFGFRVNFQSCGKRIVDGESIYFMRIRR
jgi:exodeoxyribonuclease-3